MLTQCPHCLTLFRVGPVQLKAAAGRVRCCRCHQVFNALDSLRESPAPFVNTAAGPVTDVRTFEESHEPSTEPVERALPGLEQGEVWQDSQDTQPQDEVFEPVLPDFAESEAEDEFLQDLLEQNDGLDPEPDYLAGGSESQMSELLDQDSSSILLPDSEEPIAQLSERPDEAPVEELAETQEDDLAFSTESPEPSEFEQPAQAQSYAEGDFEESILKDEAIDEVLGRPDYDSVPAFHEEEVETVPQAVDADDHALNFEPVKTPKAHAGTNLFWLIGCLLLLPPLAGQLAWQFRDNLIQHEAGRQTLKLVCGIAGCKVPVRRALDKIAIQGRNLSTRPDKPGALFLQVSIVNTAAFDQPFPQLALTLYNDKGAVIARRAFSAGDYLPPQYKRQRLMPRSQPILVEMELVDPGNEVTGFSFDFF